MKEGLEYAILTDEITRAWADRSVRDYKKFKGLKKENLIRKYLRNKNQKDWKEIKK